MTGVKLRVELDALNLITALNGNGSAAIAYWGRMDRNPHRFPPQASREHLFLVVEELGDTMATFEERKHWIRRGNLENAVALMAVDPRHCERLARLLTGAGDTEDADVLVQLAVFGAIRYS